MHHNGRTPYRGKNNDGPGSYSAPPSLLPAVLSRLGLPTAPDSSLAMEDRTHSDTRDRAWYARAEAVRALGKLGKQAPLEQVLVAMDDEHEMVRAVAIHTAGLLGKRVPLKKIIAALQDPAWHVREVAALTLASIGKRVPLEPLLAALSDPADPVRSAAHEALQQAHPDLVFESPSQVEESSPQEKANEVTQTFSLQS